MDLGADGPGLRAALGEVEDTDERGLDAFAERGRASGDADEGADRRPFDVLTSISRGSPSGAKLAMS